MLPLLAALTVVVGLPDRGIFPDLDGEIRLEAPARPPAASAWARLDGKHRVLTLYDGEHPLVAWPLVAAAAAPAAASTSARSPSVAPLSEALPLLRDGDRRSLAALAAPDTPMLR